LIIERTKVELETEEGGGGRIF